MEELPIERVEDSRPAGALTLSRLKRGLSRQQQVVYVAMLIIEANDFFNVKGNMNKKQIRLTAELILDHQPFSDLTLGNIKACFREHMMSDRLYDRLDGNIIIGWLRGFKARMADWCENRRIGEERERLREESESGTESVTYQAYIAMLESKAAGGDTQAAEMLGQCRRMTGKADRLTPEQRRQRELGFFRFKTEYLKKKGYYNDSHEGTEG